MLETTLGMKKSCVARAIFRPLSHPPLHLKRQALNTLKGDIQLFCKEGMGLLPFFSYFCSSKHPNSFRGIDDPSFLQCALLSLLERLALRWLSYGDEQQEGWLYQS